MCNQLSLDITDPMVKGCRDRVTGPVTKLIQLEPVSDTLAGEKLLESKAARKPNQGTHQRKQLVGG